MGDLISRQAAIDICNNAIDLWHGQLGEGIVIAVKKKIEELPSAQPEIMKWIPCSERLPEGKQEVLVTEYGDTDMGRRFDGRWVDRYGDKMKDVTAWMPLPEPYREEGD